MKILLVDDDSAIIQALLPVLKGTGHDIHVAISPAKALERAGALGGVDLLITDVVMEEMDGFSLREQLHAWYPEMKSIFISGYDLSEYFERLAGSPLLAKPFGPDELLAILHVVFDPPAAPVAHAVAEPEPPIAVAEAIATFPAEEATPEAAAAPPIEPLAAVEPTPEPVLAPVAEIVVEAVPEPIAPVVVEAVIPSEPDVTAPAYEPMPQPVAVAPAPAVELVAPAPEIVSEPVPAEEIALPVEVAAPIVAEAAVLAPEIVAEPEPVVAEVVPEPASVQAEPEPVVAEEIAVPLAVEAPIEPTVPAELSTPNVEPSAPFEQQSIAAEAEVEPVTAEAEIPAEPEVVEVPAVHVTVPVPVARPAKPVAVTSAVPSAPRAPVAVPRVASAPAQATPTAPRAVPVARAPQAAPAAPRAVPAAPVAVPRAATPVAVPVAKAATPVAVPVARPAAAVPVARAAIPTAVPVARPATPTAVPVAKPAVAVPVAKPATPVAVPVARAAAAAVPVVKAVAAAAAPVARAAVPSAPSAPAVARVPTASTAPTAVPVARPAAAPVAKPAVPVARPTAVPAAQPSAVPVARAATPVAVPVAKPAAAVPVAKPAAPAAVPAAKPVVNPGASPAAPKFPVSAPSVPSAPGVPVARAPGVPVARAPGAVPAARVPGAPVARPPGAAPVAKSPGVPGATPAAKPVAAAPRAPVAKPVGGVPAAKVPQFVPVRAHASPPTAPVADIGFPEEVVTESTTDHLVGETIGGYKIVSHLGDGRWGGIYAAVQTSINRPVGLKLLDPTHAVDESQKMRFIADARAKAHVQHAGILSVYEAGSADDWIFYTHEYVDGQSAEEMAAAGQKLDEPTILKLLKAAADGMLYLGKSGIPHTPMRPSDLYLGYDGQPRLANLATQLGDEAVPAELEIELLGRALLATASPEISSGLRALLARTQRTHAAAVKDWGLVLNAVMALEPKVVPVEADMISAQERAALATVEKARKQQKRALLLNIGALCSLFLFALLAVYFVWMRSGDGNINEQVRIPAGEFIFGEANSSETVGEFWIDKYEVTIGQYAKFVAWLQKNEGEQHAFNSPNQPAFLRHIPQNWEIYYSQARAKGKAHGVPITLNSPMLEVTWWDAFAYAKWQGRELPTEQEWEKAARGQRGILFPWGDEADPARANTNADFNPRDPGAKGNTDGFNFWGDVDKIKKDKSPYGVMGMAGNLSEWTGTLSGGKNGNPIIKGGNFSIPLQKLFERNDKVPPATIQEYIGFRTVTHTAPKK